MKGQAYGYRIRVLSIFIALKDKGISGERGPIWPFWIRK